MHQLYNGRSFIFFCNKINEVVQDFFHVRRVMKQFVGIGIFGKVVGKRG